MGKQENRAFDYIRWPNWIDPKEAIPYDKNAKIHDEDQVRNIANSIRRFGWQQDTVLTRDKVLVIGHGRRLAALELGCMLPYHIVDKDADELTEEDIRELRFADNLTNESPWDYALGALDMKGLSFDGFDFDLSDFFAEKEKEKVVEEDDVPEVPEEPTSKVGQMWILGRHRLICGDSTDMGTIDRLCGKDAADLLLTDPPYNVNVGNCDRPNSQNNNVHILNDSMKSDQFIEFLTKALLNASRHMRKGAGYYIWYAGLHHTEFESAILNVHDFKIHEQLVWVKSHFVLGRNSDYQWAHEPCLYGWKTGERHYFTNSRKESTVIEDVRLSTLKKEELIDLCEKLMGEDMAVSVLRADKPIAAKQHPTVKPQKLLAELLKNSTKPNWNVLDLFGGSGSTLIACEQLGRTCFMAELDPKYCDVIIQRWEKFTGKKAVLLNGEERV